MSTGGYRRARLAHTGLPLSPRRAAMRVESWVRTHSARPAWLPPRWRHIAVGYSVAVLGMAIVLGVMALIYAEAPAFSLSGALFLLVVLMVALLWGIGPAVFAVVGSTVLVNYVILTPHFTLGLHDLSDVATTVTFLAVAGAVSVVGSHATAQQCRVEDALSGLATLSRQVAAERDRLSQVLDALPVAVLICDATPTFVLSNGVARELMGRDVIGLPVPLSDEIAPVAAIPRFPDGRAYPVDRLPLQRTLLHGSEVHGAQYVLHDDATQRDIPVLADSVPLRDAQGAIVGAAVVFQDISGIRKVEQEREAFLASVSHDLRNPLTAIQGLAQLLLRRARDGAVDQARLLTGLETIVQSTVRMAAQISELVDISRLQLGRPLEVERRPLDLVALLSRLVQVHEEASAGHLVRLRTPLRSLSISGDELRLERAISNLLTNAVKYSPEGSTITAALDRRVDAVGSWAILSVADQGIGIPEADLPHVFDLFYRADNAVEIAPGSGLGLSGVRQVVLAHGGTVGIASEDGMGTTVSIELPLMGADPAAPPR